MKANTNISKRMRKRYCVLISLGNEYLELAKHSLSWEKSKGENERRKRNEGVYGLIGWQWWEFSATLNKFLIKQSIHIIFSISFIWLNASEWYQYFKMNDTAGSYLSSNFLFLDSIKLILWGPLLKCATRNGFRNVNILFSHILHLCNSQNT